MSNDPRNQKKPENQILFRDPNQRPARIPSSHCRLNVVGDISFQQYDGQPTSLHILFGQDIATDEQAYQRRIDVTEEWKPIDVLWLERIGLIVVQNHAYRFQRNPTPEEEAEAKSRVIELAVCQEVVVPEQDSTLLFCLSFAELRPGASTFFAPVNNDVGSYRIRCRNGMTRATIMALPA